MKYALLASLFFFTFLNVKAQQSHEDDLIKLKELNARFIHNFVTNDTASHSEIIHDKFVCITSEGRTIGRKEYLENWQHGYDGYIYWDYRDENITIIGNTALVRSQNKFIVVTNGKTRSGMSMYTDTYVKENSLWKCVQAQLVKVLPENYADDKTIVRKYGGQ